MLCTLMIAKTKACLIIILQRTRRKHEWQKWTIYYKLYLLLEIVSRMKPSRQHRQSCILSWQWQTLKFGTWKRSFMAYRLNSSEFSVWYKVCSALYDFHQEHKYKASADDSGRRRSTVISGNYHRYWSLYTKYIAANETLSFFFWQFIIYEDDHYYYYYYYLYMNY